VSILRERTEIEKLRYAMLELTRLARDNDPHLRVYVLSLGHTLGFDVLLDTEPDTKGDQ
jgi:hypothetical protein